MRSSLPLVVVVLLAATAPVGCGSNLNGRVFLSNSSFIQWVGDGPMPAGGEPVQGATITVTSDPQSPGRQVVGRGVSAADGSFSVKLDAFGAGWMQDDWLIVVARGGVGRAEFLGPLSLSQTLLVTLAPGSDRGPSSNDFWNGSIGTNDSGSSLMEEAKHFGSSSSR